MSEEAKYTPGPSGESLNVTVHRDNHCEAEANARLIAAAPDLLKASKRALAVLRATGESIRPGNALGALVAAIAKAEGKSQ